MPKAARTHIERNYREQDRPSAASRGYDSRWQKVRKHFLKRNPLCIECLKYNRTVPSKEAHHIKPLKKYPELKYVESNLEALCKPCHSAKTRKKG